MTSAKQNKIIGEFLVDCLIDAFSEHLTGDFLDKILEEVKDANYDFIEEAIAKAFEPHEIFPEV